MVDRAAQAKVADYFEDGLQQSFYAVRWYNARVDNCEILPCWLM